MNNTIIRKAEPKDVPAILGLVRELAEYEESLDSVEVNLEIYERDFDLKNFHSIVAEVDGKVVGMMLYFPAYSSWKGKMLYLDDFMITESHRRAGIGKLLFNRLIEESKAMNANLIKWQVLDWNKPAIAFYEKYEAHFQTDWYNCLLYKGDIERWK